MPIGKTVPPIVTAFLVVPHAHGSFKFLEGSMENTQPEKLRCVTFIPGSTQPLAAFGGQQESRQKCPHNLPVVGYILFPFSIAGHQPKLRLSSS